MSTTTLIVLKTVRVCRLLARQDRFDVLRGPRVKKSGDSRTSVSFGELQFFFTFCFHGYLNYD